MGGGKPPKRKKTGGVRVGGLKLNCMYKRWNQYTGGRERCQKGGKFLTLEFIKETNGTWTGKKKKEKRSRGVLWCNRRYRGHTDINRFARCLRGESWGGETPPRVKKQTIYKKWFNRGGGGVGGGREKRSEEEGTTERLHKMAEKDCC